MPLNESTSKKAFSENVEAEMDAGKPQKQAVAIAYSEKAKAAGVKHLADGGVADDEEDLPPPQPAPEPVPPPPGPTVGVGAVALDRANGNVPLAADAAGNLAPAASPAPAKYDLPEGTPTLAPVAADDQAAPAAAPAVDPYAAARGDERALEAARTKAADLSGLAPQQQALQQAMKAEGDTVAAGGKAESDIANAGADQLAAADKDARAREEAQQKAIQPLLAKLAATKIDPQQHWKSLGWGAKTSVIIGQALGAFASGYTGRPNDAARMLSSAIENNIAAQKTNAAVQGQAIEFMRANDLDQNQFDSLMRLSARQQMADRLDAVKSNNLSQAKQASLETLRAQNNLEMARLQAQLAGGANVANAESRMALDTAAGTAQAAAAAPPKAKPEDVDKANKAALATKHLDDYLKLVDAGYQAMGPGGFFTAPVDIAKVVPGSGTQQAIDARPGLVHELAIAMNPDASRAPSPEFEKEIESQIPDPYLHPEQNKNRYHLMRGRLIDQGKAHIGAAFGNLLPENVATMNSAPAELGKVRVQGPDGQIHVGPAQNVSKLPPGYKVLGPA